jgi:hypothetical protein
MRWLTTASRSRRVVSGRDPRHEVLGHRDLHSRRGSVWPALVIIRKTGEISSRPIPEVVVDAEELRLVDVLVQLGGERAR